MIYCENSSLQALSLSIVGNRLHDDGVQKSECLIELNDKLRQVLVQYFISSFKTEERYRFFHHSGLDFNFVYSLVTDIFNSPEMLLEYSGQLADQLYEMSGHNMIKSGEFYVAYFNQIEFDGQKSDAIGLFKSENKDTFLMVSSQNRTTVIEQLEGTDIRKLDKGCLIFNTKKEEGYRIAVVDNSNNSEAKYWIEDFLNIKPCQDNYFQTRNFMTVCKNFLSKQLPEEFEVSKADQVELLNKSVQYFKENEEEFFKKYNTKNRKSEAAVMEKKEMRTVSTAEFITSWNEMEKYWANNDGDADENSYYNRIINQKINIELPMLGIKTELFWCPPTVECLDDMFDRMIDDEYLDWLVDKEQCYYTGGGIWLAEVPFEYGNKSLVMVVDNEDSSVWAVYQNVLKDNGIYDSVEHSELMIESGDSVHIVPDWQIYYIKALQLLANELK